VSVSGSFAVVARIRPKPDAEERLLTVRDQMVGDFKVGVEGFVSASLYRIAESDEWLDVFVFTDRAAADAAHVNTPGYREWDSLVDLVGYEYAEPLTHHEC
jgi:quinol monooxygenase YgiN